MTKDRYGNEFSSGDAIVVFDQSLDYDSELFEVTVGLKLRDFDRGRYSSVYEVDLGAGADWPMVAYELADKYIPISAFVATFFLGEKIEKAALSWVGMFKKLMSCIPRDGFTDANGAALLALERVLDYSSSVQLIAYTWVDEEIEFFDEPDRASAAFDIIAKLDEIEPREKQFGIGLHSIPTFLFKFETEAGVVLASVKGREVKLLEL